jgi:hypothetical protein
MVKEEEDRGHKDDKRTSSNRNASKKSTVPLLLCRAARSRSSLEWRCGWQEMIAQSQRNQVVSAFDQSQSPSLEQVCRAQHTSSFSSDLPRRPVLCRAKGTVKNPSFIYSYNIFSYSSVNACFVKELTLASYATFPRETICRERDHVVKYPFVGKRARLEFTAVTKYFLFTSSCICYKCVSTETTNEGRATWWLFSEKN